MTEWLVPLACGLGAGILSAWGVGGGTILLLVMTLLLDVDQRTALVCHARSGCLDKPVLRSAIPLAVVAAVVGAWIATAVDPELLRKPFGVYLLLSGASLLWPKRKKAS